MRTISVIFPINNPAMLSQRDLEPYQSPDCRYILNAVDTSLREITTPKEGAYWERKNRMIFIKIV